MAKKKEYVDAKGDRVPAKYVSRYDKERDRIANRIADRWANAEHMLMRVKVETVRDIEALVALAQETSGVNLGGEKGNVQFRNFCGDVTVSLDRQVRSEFDERLGLAQQLIMEAVRDMAKDARNADLVEIATRAFQPRKSGRLDMQRVKDLRSYKVSHPKWKQACEIITECERVVGSRLYIRVSKRAEPDAKPVPFCLDIAAL